MPRLGQCIVDPLFDRALPRWESDPTFDLEFHLRRDSLHARVTTGNELVELFHAIGPIYERPFDPARSLRELIEIDRHGGRSALFWRLHHSIADGVGANAVLAALTDSDRESEPCARFPETLPGAWPGTSFATVLGQALRDRLEDERAFSAAGRIRDLVREQSESPAVDVFPLVSHLLAILPRRIHRAAVLASGSSMDLIVTHIPGIPVTRYLAGTEITAAYPIAPTVPHCPVSVALYGNRDSLFIGLDADGAAMPDPNAFSGMLERSFEELVRVASAA